MKDTQKIRGNTSPFKLLARLHVLHWAVLFFSVSPEESELFLAMDKKALQEGRSEVLEKVTMFDGRTLVLHTHKIRFENSAGEPFILGIARDVTERKAIIAKLEQSNKELEHFAYAASHDLQEPLRMISSYCDLLESEYGDKLDANGKEFIHYAVDAAKRMSALKRLSCLMAGLSKEHC